MMKSLIFCLSISALFYLYIKGIVSGCRSLGGNCSPFITLKVSFTCLLPLWSFHCLCDESCIRLSLLLKSHMPFSSGCF